MLTNRGNIYVSMKKIRCFDITNRDRYSQRQVAFVLFVYSQDFENLLNHSSTIALKIFNLVLKRSIVKAFLLYLCSYITKTR